MAGPGVLLSRYDGWSEPGDEVKGRKRLETKGVVPRRSFRGGLKWARSPMPLRVIVGLIPSQGDG